MMAAWPSLIITYMNAPTDFWCARPAAAAAAAAAAVYTEDGTAAAAGHAPRLAAMLDPTALEWGIEVNSCNCSLLRRCQGCTIVQCCRLSQNAF